MFLKTIEIQGFKSFPDKTVLNFGRGVTAIVGPNGSGKSNIVDAIRWVLGEQSSKTLRGGKMEDVIFGGTQKRRPVSFCDVTLVLDNSDAGLPMAFAEVSVTRRYFRSGESEFYINRKSVRLKDVHELFMDTGLGRDGYSIVGQGRIDEILSVKSTDRREIFEEAAGITRFRSRKEESERRLKACEENLVRVRDIISELEAQVGPLRAQAEKARSFLLLRDELRALEVSIWMLSLDKLKDTLQAAQTDYDNACRMLSAVKREQQELLERSQGITEQIAQRDIYAEQEREKLHCAEALENEVSSAIAVYRNTISINEENILGKTRELEAQTSRGQGLEEQLKAKNTEKARLEAEDAALVRELEELMLSSREAAQNAQDTAQKLDAVNAELDACRRLAADVAAESAALETGKTEVLARLNAVNREIEALSARMEEESERAKQISREIGEQNDKKQSAQNMLKGFELRRSAREKKRDELSALHTRLSRERDAKIDRRRMLEALEKDYEGFSGAVKRVMQAKSRGELRGILGTVADIIETDEKYSLAIEIALGGGLQNIVVEAEQDGKAAINYLKTRDVGRATFLPLTSVKPRGGRHGGAEREHGFLGWADALARCDARYDRVVSSLLGGTAVADNLDSAVTMARAHDYAFRIVTLDGQLINPSGAMTGGSAGKNTGVLARAGEIRRLGAEIEEADTQILAHANMLKDAQRELDAALYESRAAEAELRQAEDALLTLSAEKQQHGALIETLKMSEISLTRELESGRERMENAESIFKEKADTLEKLSTRETEILSERERLHGGQKIAEEHTGQLASKSAGMREKLAGTRSALDAETRAIAELEALIASMDEERDSKIAAIDAILQQNAELSLQIEHKLAEKQQHGALAESLREKIKSIRDERLNLEGARAKTEREAQAKTNELVNLERESSRLENRKTQAEMEEDAIIERLWENYELTRVTARQVQIELESTSRANRRIGELKAAIKKLGDVSLASIDEFERVNTRYTSLSAQKDDLEKASADLLKIIDELTENMKSIFAAEFYKINEMFKTTFAEIFGGGTGFLKLEDESDILNCGIEIKVELPGNSMRVISLLSGGEKAFVAIALYFAIIKVRPTPFCVLDEIDAALDNINVTRFSDYLHTLSALTQFIVITHRRGTMEGADILYGVTMQEKGVTKLLALDISEAEKQIKAR